MKIGRHRDESPGEAGAGVRANALVVETDHPVEKLDAVVSASKVARGTVRILVEGVQESPIYASRTFKLTRDRWLVRGMEIPVTIDPQRPDEFEIAWDGIPAIEERVAVNDPTLADPLGTQQKVEDAMRAAGFRGPDLGKVPGGMGDLAARSQEAASAATPDRYAEAVERASREQAPPGKVRAVVLIATTTTSVVRTGATLDGSGGRNVRDSSGRHDAVLAVTVPGRNPYAVFVRGFKRPSNTADIAKAGFPALVSATDPNAVEVLWEELPSALDQVGQRMADGLGGATAGMREEMEMREQMMGALQQASTNPQAPPATPGQMPQLPPGMQEMMAQNAKQALQFVTDPAMRSMLIQQYRAAGIEVDEGNETG